MTEPTNEVYRGPDKPRSKARGSVRCRNTSPATDLLQHMSMERALTLAELVAAAGVTEYFVKLWLKQLQVSGAVVCVRGVANTADDGSPGRRYWRYLKTGDDATVDAAEAPVSEGTLETVHAALVGYDRTPSVVSIATKIPLPLVNRALSILVERDEVGAALNGTFKACRVREPKVSTDPFEWRSYRSEHSPKDWDTTKPSTYKSLPKDLDL